LIYSAKWRLPPNKHAACAAAGCRQSAHSEPRTNLRIGSQRGGRGVERRCGTRSSRSVLMKFVPLAFAVSGATIVLIKSIQYGRRHSTSRTARGFRAQLPQRHERTHRVTHRNPRVPPRVGVQCARHASPSSVAVGIGTLYFARYRHGNTWVLCDALQYPILLFCTPSYSLQCCDTPVSAVERAWGRAAIPVGTPNPTIN
jgi:hypothetical protein